MFRTIAISFTTLESIMSGGSSSEARWSSRLDSVQVTRDVTYRPDDPRLGEAIEVWHGDPAALTPGRAVLIGFPQDEGVRRNGGRTGTAAAPDAIRRCLSRLTPSDCQANVHLTDPAPLDLGNLRVSGDLEQTQA